MTNTSTAKQFYLSFLLSVLLFSCANATQQQDPIPAHESFKIVSKHTGDTRTINVWTPPGYNINTDSLPVMYMADGGLKEDFPHIANTIAELIQSKSITPVILVGIENTQRRRDLTGPTEVKKDKEIAPVVGRSEQFRAFINEELFPEINKKYGTSDKRGLLGESLSGLFVMETFFLKPEMFDYYIAFDPSLWWNNHDLVKTAEKQLSKLPATNKKLWFASSNAADIYPFTKELAEILKKQNIKSLSWDYSPEPKEEHSTIFRATKEKALKWMLSN